MTTTYRLAELGVYRTEPGRGIKCDGIRLDPLPGEQYPDAVPSSALMSPLDAISRAVEIAETTERTAHVRITVYPQPYEYGRGGWA